MKNQFFGDIRDYRKYGLLRVLGGNKKNSVAVCWMRTPDAEGAGGNHTKYLLKPGKWRRFDIDLFNSLWKAVNQHKRRDVARAEIPGILNPRVFTFYKKEFRDSIDKRRVYFGRFLSHAKGRDLIFFDPDNGLEVRSTRLGMNGSSKFLYFEELSQAFRMGHSILVFQFFMMKRPEEVIAERTKQIFAHVKVGNIASFKTPSVIYFLIPQPRHKNELRKRTQLLRPKWGKQIVLKWHSRRSAH